MVDTLKNWEYFRDAAYYDKWAVRNKLDKAFTSAIHVETFEEAEFLVDELNGKESLTAQLEEARKALRTFIYETTHLSACENDGSHWCKISKETLEKGRAIYYKLHEEV